MKLLSFLILFLSVALLSAQEKSKAFDFWIGEWNVYWYRADSSIVEGTNHIFKILDDKAIEENFSDPSRSFNGKSISVYNPITQRWHQAWVDNQGGFYNFIGDITNDRKIFETDSANAQGYRERMIFEDIEENSLTWRWQSKREDDDLWNDLWVIYYQRKQ